MIMAIIIIKIATIIIVVSGLFVCFYAKRFSQLNYL